MPAIASQSCRMSQNHPHFFVRNPPNAFLLWFVLCCVLANCSPPVEKARASLEKLGIHTDPAAVVDAARRGNAAALELLHQADISLTQPDAQGDTPLIAAVRNNSPATPRLLELLPPEAIDQTDAAGRTALSHAVEAKLPKIAQQVLQRGANPEKSGHPGGSIIAAVLRQHEPDLAAGMISACPKASPLFPDALLAAVENGDAAATNLLLSRGVPAEFTTASGETGLYLAAKLGHLEVARSLIAQGARAPKMGGSPMANILSFAVRHRNVEMARLLLGGGAEPNRPNLDQVTPLALAVKNSDLPMTALLLENGGDARTCFAAAFAARDLAVMQLLATHGADTSAPLPDGDVPLVAAVRKKDLDLVKFLTSHGTRLDAPGLEGQAAFNLAMAMRQVPMLEHFLELGWDSNTPFASPPQPEFHARITSDYFKKWLLKDSRLTPLMLAAAKGDVEVLRLLLKHGAKRGLTTKNWKRFAVNFACEQGQISAAQLLLGRDPDSGRDVRIVVSLGRQRATFFKDGRAVRSTNISTGRKGFSTPTGQYVISDKQTEWQSSIYKVPMPYFMRLSCKDFGLHAGVVTGRPASHGCIRLPKGEAQAFFSLAQIGDPVTIE